MRRDVPWVGIDLPKSVFAMNEWINVKEKLPEPDTFVLSWCLSRGGKNTTFEYQEGYAAIDSLVNGEFFRTDMFYNARVTHWMPLPEPPNES